MFTSSNSIHHFTEKQPSSRYRPDIDGLRAIAAGLVLILHAFPQFLPGGFIGVDIFFVISGFLIGGILIAQMEEGSLSFSNFFKRRILRIFPSVLIVLSFSLLVGFFLLSTTEFKFLSESSLYSLFFISNLFFWSEINYFAPSADSITLLHFWSLGVEEQFYLLFPILFLINNVRILLSILLIITFLSLIYSINLTYDDRLAAYYNPVSRFWELLSGSILAFLQHFKRRLSGENRRRSLLFGAIF